MNTCNNCDCVLSESDLAIEIETDDENYYLCIDCTDNKSDDEKIIAVWKFGTSVGIDEDDEFDVNDYKDHMFVDEEEEEEEEAFRRAEEGVYEFPSNQLCRHCEEKPITRGESLCRSCFLSDVA
jgi:hypothetical protein